MPSLLFRLSGLDIPVYQFAFISGDKSQGPLALFVFQSERGFSKLHQTVLALADRTLASQLRIEFPEQVLMMMPEVEQKLPDALNKNPIQPRREHSGRWLSGDTVNSSMGFAVIESLAANKLSGDDHILKTHTGMISRTFGGSSG